MKTQTLKVQTPTRHSYTWFLAAIGLMLMTMATARADYQSTVLGDTPLLYYALDSSVTGGTATDLTANGNNGNSYNLTTATGPSPYITGAAYFDGSDASIDVAGSPSLLNFSGPITLEAWVQPGVVNVGGLGNIIAKGYNASLNYEIVLRDNNPNFYANSGSTGVGGGTQSTNWTYLVMSSDGVNNILYVNGIQVSSSPDTGGSKVFPNDWAIGTGSPDGDYGTGSRYFNGNMAQVAIYNHGLTASQVLTHYYMGEINASPSVSAPIITVQPKPQATYLTGSATFSVTAVSAYAMTNQWLKNGNPISGQTGTTLTLANVQAGDVANYSVIVGNINGITTSPAVALTLYTPANLTWNGQNSATWDTGSSVNWTNQSTLLETVFNTGDNVLFDDTAGVPTSVTVSGTVAPSLITVNSSVNNFTIDQGTVTGSGGLVKKGSSQLTIYDAGTLTGPVTISGGSIYAGNNTFSSVASITITNSATLDLAGGTLSGNKPITVSGSGLNGEGAIFNSYNDYPGQTLSITLAGDATFGASARWDLVNGSQISGPHKLTLDWSAGSGYGEWNTVTIGADVTGITLTNGTLGSKNMDSTFQNPGTVFTISPGRQLVFWNGGWNGSLHALNGSQIVHYTAPSGFHGSNIALEDSVDFQSYGNTDQTTPVDSAITLNGVAHFEFGDHNLLFTGLISGPGGFVWDHWNHQMVLSVANTYTGPTVIGDGPQVALVGSGSIADSSLIFFGGNNSGDVHIDASGRPDQTLTLASGQTLGGIGAISGSLTVGAGATLSPAGTNTTIGITTGANATGTISATSAVILNGTTTLKLNGSGTNDQIQAGAGITYGGTLNLVNISGAPLAAGNSFQIFNAASYTAGSYTITPATPGAGLAWGTSQLNTLGVVAVVSTSKPVVNNVQTLSGKLIFSGTNGTASGSYAVLTATNLTTSLANWTPLVTNSFDGSGAFSVTNDVSVGTPQRFYIIKLVP